MAEQAQATDTGPRPIVPWLKLGPKPHLEGIKCVCGAIYLDPKRVACSKCGETDKFQPLALSDKGKSTCSRSSTSRSRESRRRT